MSSEIGDENVVERAKSNSLQLVAAKWESDNRDQAPGSGERVLVVQVVGLRGLNPSLRGKKIYAKASINSVQRRTRTSKAERDVTSDECSAYFSEDEVMVGWDIGHLVNLSFEDLLVVRVKHLASMGRGVAIGVVSIAVRRVSALGRPGARAWFPLSRYKRTHSSEHSEEERIGEVCLSLYWAAPAMIEHLTSINQVVEIKEDCSEQEDLDGSFETSSVASHKSTKSFRSAGLFLSGQAARLGKRRSLQKSIKAAVGLTVHKTQEMLVNAGVSQEGLALDSQGVQVEPGSGWLKEPIHEEPEEDLSVIQQRRQDEFLEFVGKEQDLLEQQQEQRQGQGQFEAEIGKPLEKPSSEIAHHSRPVLLVEIIQARGLLAMDSNGLSDPYCVLGVKSAKRKTNVVSKSLKPTWDEKFIFGGDNQPHELISLDDTLVVVLKDKDFTFDDDLGTVEVPLWAIPRANSAENKSENSNAGINGDDGGVKAMPTIKTYGSIDCDFVDAPAKWYSLEKTARMKTVRGELKMRISYFSGTDIAGTPGGTVTEKVEDPQQRLKGSLIVSAVKQPLGVLGSAGRRASDTAKDAGGVLKQLVMEDGTLPRQSGRIVSWRYCKAMSVLNIRIVQARNLIAADANGLSDPYAFVQVRKTRFQTPVHKRTLNPVWDATFEFGKGHELLTELDTIEIIVKDHDRIKRDDDLGCVRLPLWSIIGHSGGPLWYALSPVSDKVLAGSVHGPMQDLGEIQLDFSMTIEQPKEDLPGSGTLSSPLVGEHGLGQQVGFGSSSSSSPSTSPSKVARAKKGISRGHLSEQLLEQIASAKSAQYKAYSGKVWFFKMHIYVIGAADLTSSYVSKSGGLDSFVTVTCGTESKRTKTAVGSSSPFYKERFLFEHSSTPHSKGLSRQDRIYVTVRSPHSESGEIESDSHGGYVLASTHIDLAYLIDKMGFIDKDGMRLQSWFSLDDMDSSNDMKSAEQSRPRLKLGIQLTPSAETRLEIQEKLCVRINRGRGLGGTSEQIYRNVFFRVKVGRSCLAETALKRMSHGHVVSHRELYFESLDAAEVDESLTVYVCAEDSGEAFARFECPMKEIASAPGRLLEGWFPLEFFNETEEEAALALETQRAKLMEQNGGASDSANVRRGRSSSTAVPLQYSVPGSPKPVALKEVSQGKKALMQQMKRNFADLTVSDAEIHVSLRLLKIQEYLEPVLGTINLEMFKLKIHSNDFNNNLRCVIKYGDRLVATKTYHGVVNILFNPGRAKFRFPVRDVFTELEFQVWKIPDSENSVKQPKLLGTASVNVFDMIEFEAAAAFRSEAIGAGPTLDPVKLSLLSKAGKKTGKLQMNLQFVESLAGSLATHANPSLHKEKPFSVENFRHEVSRTQALLAGFGQTAGSIGYVLNWGGTKSSMAGLAIYVLLCVLDFWTSRFLALFPFCGVIYIINRHRDRVYGTYASNLLQKSGIGENDTKARLVVSVERGRGLMAMDDNGKSDPLVHVTLVNGTSFTKPKTRRTKLGNTSTVYKTLSPHWAASPIGFKTNPGTSLVQWRNHSSDEALAAFECFIPRILFTRTVLDAIIVGTRGLVSGDFPRLQQQQIQQQQMQQPIRVFQVAVNSVSHNIFSTQKQKVMTTGRKQPNSSGKKFSSSLKYSSEALQAGAAHLSPLLAVRKRMDSPRNRSMSDDSAATERSRAESAESAASSLALTSNPRAATTSGKSFIPSLVKTLSSLSVGSETEDEDDGKCSSKICHDRPFYKIEEGGLDWLPDGRRALVVSGGKSSGKKGDSQKSKVAHNGTMVPCSTQALSPLDKTILLDLLKLDDGGEKLGYGQYGQNRAKKEEVHTGPVAALRNPKFNETLRLGGQGSTLDQADFVIVTFRCQNSASSLTYADVAYAFIPLKIFTQPGQTINAWFPLEMLEHQAAEQNDRFRVIGEILLSLALKGANDMEVNVEGSVSADAPATTGGTGSNSDSLGLPVQPKGEDLDPLEIVRARDLAHQKQHSEGDSEERMIITAGTIDDYPDEPWSRSTAVLTFDVFDEDNYSKREFIGRATLPLSALVLDDQKQDQPILHQWLPLSIRFDGSKADEALWCSAQGRTYSHSSRASKVSAARHKRNTSLTALRERLRGASSAPTSAQSRSSSFDEGDEKEVDDELSFDWIQEGPPFGEILVRAHLTLPDPAAEEAYRNSIEAKKADRSGPVEQIRLIKRVAQSVQNQIFRVNNQLEQAKNLFNWTHPKKTRLVLYILSFLCVLFLIVPSRIILLFLGVFFFTERFRPLGTVVIKLKHLTALLPTNEDIVNLYTSGPLLGSYENNSASSLEGNSDESSEAAAAAPATTKLSTAKFYQNMRERYINLGLGAYITNRAHKEAQESKKIVSESDLKATGHLRYLRDTRSKTWKRAYFGIAHRQLLLWEHKEQMLLHPAQIGWGELTYIGKVSKNSKDADFLATRGVARGTLDSTIVFEHPANFSPRSDLGTSEEEQDGEKSSGPKMPMLPTRAAPAKTTRSYLVANSPEKRDFWIQNMKNYCQVSNKAMKKF